MPVISQTNPMPGWWLPQLALGIAMLMGCICPLYADTCTASGGGTYSFGTANSFQVKNNPQTTVASQMASCNGVILNALVILGNPPPYLRATLNNSSNGFRLKNSAGDEVPYAIYADPGSTFPITPEVTFNYYQDTLLDLLGLLGGTSGGFPMYFQTEVGHNLSAGTYTDSFSIHWEWRICTLGVAVCLLYTTGSGNTPVTLTMDVTEACEITAAPDIDFGQAPTPDSFPTIVSSVSVLCTKNATSFSVGMGPGQHSDGNGGRRLMSGSSHLLYNIYKEGGTAIWGDAGGDRVSGNGVPFDGVTPRALPYEARITASQPLVPVGVYSDSIIVDVTF